MWKNERHLNLVYRPATFDSTRYRTERLFDPSDDEEAVTVISAEALDHREPDESEATGPSKGDSLPEAVFAARATA